MDIKKEANKAMKKAKKETYKVMKDAQKWARENKDELTVAGILVGTAVVGGVIGYQIHVNKAQKSLDKTVKLIRESEMVYTQVYDKATKETTHIISMTADRFGKMVKDLEGAVK